VKLSTFDLLAYQEENKGDLRLPCRNATELENMVKSLGRQVDDQGRVGLCFYWWFLKALVWSRALLLLFFGRISQNCLGEIHSEGALIW